MMKNAKEDREYWVVNDSLQVMYRATSKHVAISYACGRGHGHVVKVKAVTAPTRQRLPRVG